jgi:hypothetical protein
MARQVSLEGIKVRDSKTFINTKYIDKKLVLSGVVPPQE